MWVSTHAHKKQIYKLPYTKGFLIKTGILSSRRKINKSPNIKGLKTVSKLKMCASKCVRHIFSTYCIYYYENSTTNQLSNAE